MYHLQEHINQDIKAPKTHIKQDEMLILVFVRQQNLLDC